MAPALCSQFGRIRPGGIARRLVIQQSQEYAAAHEGYERRVREHRRNFGSVGLEKIQVPDMPVYLAYYFELKRWGHLLNAGGLLDQPDWVWGLIDLAGGSFEAAYGATQELRELGEGE